MPPNNRRQRKRQQTRDFVAEVGFDLFEDQGFEAVTMEQIAKRADVARGTVYNHFPVKEAVLVHAMHMQLEHDLESLRQEVLQRTGFLARAATLLDASASWWNARRHYLAPYIRFRFQQVDGDVGDAASDMIALWEALIGQAQGAGELRADLPAGQMAQYLHFLYLSALMRWLADADLALDDAMADMLGFFMDGAAVVRASRA